jgi:hypothetical protein
MKRVRASARTFFSRETLHKSTSEMKRKAQEAQEPEHMGYM